MVEGGRHAGEDRSFRSHADHELLLSGPVFFQLLPIFPALKAFQPSLICGQATVGLEMLSRTKDRAYEQFDRQSSQMPEVGNRKP